MPDTAPAGSTVPPWTLSVGAMLSVQLGSALSVPLIGAVGAAGTGTQRGGRRTTPPPDHATSATTAQDPVLLPAHGSEPR